MITPPYLRHSDRIGIIGPARKIKPGDIQKALRTFSSWGLEVKNGEYLFEQDRQFAGNDQKRAEDIQNMLDDPQIKAILCARGGYGTVRIIDRLNFRAFMKYPKWIAGFSDITVLHSHIHSQLGIETLHSPMPTSFKNNKLSPEGIESLRKALFGEPLEYRYKTVLPGRKGKARGLLTGGNLSILYSLNNTPSDIDTQGKILFLEDLDEYLYHIDRMILNLKRSGKLKNLAALIVGGMTQLRDNRIAFGRTAREIILEAVAEYNYPVCFDFPAGHLENNLTLIMGREAVLEVGNSVKLTFNQ